MAEGSNGDLGMPTRSRSRIPMDVQLAVLFRDQWLCYLCRRPLIFPPAMRFLADLVAEGGIEPAPAYYNQQWRRDAAPLLDELAASIDHVEAFAKGGADDASNFAAVCARCNARKSARRVEDYLRDANPWRAKGRHGEPQRWDGFCGVFFVLASRTARSLTRTEQGWLSALRAHYAQAAAP